MSSGIEILAHERKRGMSWIVAQDFSGGSCRSMLDRLAPSLELSLSEGFGVALGKHWIELETSDVLAGLSSAAGWRALVPDDNLVRTRSVFQSMKRFSDRFDESSRAFSNWCQVAPHVSTWLPMSGSTFDRAFGVVRGNCVGIICAEWED